jgi:hypothetical protein
LTTPRFWFVSWCAVLYLVGNSPLRILDGPEIHGHLLCLDSRRPCPTSARSRRGTRHDSPLDSGRCSWRLPLTSFPHMTASLPTFPCRHSSARRRPRAQTIGSQPLLASRPGGSPRKPCLALSFGQGRDAFQQYRFPSVTPIPVRETGPVSMQWVEVCGGILCERALCP